jgi:hypothetical protein
MQRTIQLRFSAKLGEEPEVELTPCASFLRTVE